ncbi:hypothetical protein EK904_013251 [Melospiza melodia maxima]|nr:hypothetical protein EK904_013251 [Melospiza melodia maxima]
MRNLQEKTEQGPEPAARMDTWMDECAWKWHSFRVLNEGEKKNSHVIIALKFRHHKHQTNNSPACDVSQTKHPWMPQHVPVLPEITPLLTSYLSSFALVVIYKEQNPISRLNPTVNIPRNSLDGGSSNNQKCHALREATGKQGICIQVLAVQEH